MTTISKPMSIWSRILRKLCSLIVIGIVRAIDVVVLAAGVGVRTVMAWVAAYLVIRYPMDWLIRHASLLVQIMALLILFPLVAVVVSEFVSEEGAKRALQPRQGMGKLGKWETIGYPLFVLFMAMPYFSGVSCILKEFNLISITPDFPLQDNCMGRFADFYAWHFLDAIPLLDINKTILWTVPYEYKDSLSGFILLFFKILVILPVIRAYVVWREVTKKKDESKEQPAKSAVPTEATS